MYFRTCFEIQIGRIQYSRRWHDFGVHAVKLYENITISRPVQVCNFPIYCAL